VKKSCEILEELSSLGFSYFFVFLSCNLGICCNGYLFWYYSEVFLVSSPLWRALSPVLLREEKTNSCKSKNILQAGAVCELRTGQVKSHLSASGLRSPYKLLFFVYMEPLLPSVSFVACELGRFQFIPSSPHLGTQRWRVSKPGVVFLACWRVG
jgi:hypothetical protein